MLKLRFPPHFLWGASTSAYQVEGGHADDGKGESIWDRFTHESGRILNNDTGDVACDHYHRWEDDVRLMKELGITAYGLSISWSRVLPEGRGVPNRKGLDFYRRLVALLRDNGITPAVALYHWDLPQALQDLGGWASRETAEHFGRYALLMFEELGDSAPMWRTFNEPWVSAMVGYFYGGHPPGIRDLPTALRAAHNILLAHGIAVQGFRQTARKGEIGISLNLNPVYPATPQALDLDAATRYSDFVNGWFLDPLLKGAYPQRLVDWLCDRAAVPCPRNEDMDIISTPMDFLGVNYYAGACVAHDARKPPLQTSFMQTGKPKTDSGWEIYPEGIFDLLSYIHREYKSVKLLVTENGAAFRDSLDAAGEVQDEERICFIRDHIVQVHRAMTEGVNVAGYFVWSLMDNFEWNLGYSRRFGLVHVDYTTQRRTIKGSGRWYRRVIESSGESIR